MLSLLKNLFHRPVIRFGSTRDARGRFRNPRFASFISENNRKTLDTRLHDAVLQGRKLLRYAFVTALACIGAWVLVESAHALSMF